MKILKLFIVAVVSTVFFAVSIAAQTENKPDVSKNKIASVDTKAFEDEKSGIKELAIAYDQLYTELNPQIKEL